jgi:hypothetical protein
MLTPDRGTCIMAITPISTLPTAPARTDAPAVFVTNADAFLGAIVVMQGQLNTSIGEMNTDIPTAITAASDAAQSAIDADAAATAAENFSSAIEWVSGTTYALGDVVWSPINYLPYRRIIAGAGATDPSADAVNWLSLAGASLGANTFTGTQNFADNTLQRANLLDYGEVTNAIGSTGGGTQDIDLTLGNYVTATVDTSANTFTFSNPTASDEGCGFTLVLTNGGSQTVTWPASVDWPAGTAPTLTAAGVDKLVFETSDGGTTWLGNLAGLEYA